MYFDCHGDVFTDITIKRLAGEKDVFRKHHLPSYKQSGINGGIFVFWVDPPYTDDPMKRFKQIEEAAKAEMEDAKDIIHQVKTFADFEKAEKENKMAIMFGAEGLSHIGKDIDFIDYMYNEIGTRHAGLTWNEQNDLATGVRGDDSRGLTEYGVEAIKRIEKLGMVLDVSHLNEKSFWDLTKVITGPIIASHSNSKVLCAAKRNLTDDQIKAIVETDGIIGMNSYAEFTADYKAGRTSHMLALHAARIAEKFGVKHVACGFDFNDYLDSSTGGSFIENPELPGVPDLNGASQGQNFITSLRQVGFNEEEIEMIKYKNAMRVFKKVLK